LPPDVPARRSRGRETTRAQNPRRRADLSYLLLQINVICALLFLIGTTAIVKHPDWFGEVPVTSQSLAAR
jgi:hypothetical protein